jgi:hypothetical protein
MRSAAQNAQERRRALVVTAAMMFVAAGATIAVLAASVNASRQASRDTTFANTDDLRSGRITRETDAGDCVQQGIDNRTGRVTSTARPCEAVTYDSNGMPVPTGTIHRLDAISKSFGNH